MNAARHECAETPNAEVAAKQKSLRSRSRRGAVTSGAERRFQCLVEQRGELPRRLLADVTRRRPAVLAVHAHCAPLSDIGHRARQERRLVAAGATRIEESDAWPSAPGAYVLVRGGAAVAWVVPEEVGRAGGDDPTGGASETAAADSASFRIVGSHTDSPALKLKPSPALRSAGWTQLGMEVYGGGLLNSWLDRDLGGEGDALW